MNSRITVLGAGAFGTSLALVYARLGRQVHLIARDAATADAMQASRTTGPRLHGFSLPSSLTVGSSASEIDPGDILLLAVPTQSLGHALEDLPKDVGVAVACCKGIDLATGLGPTSLITRALPESISAIMTGPSFAVDLANSMPTALTLATTYADAAVDLQAALSTPTLRLYRTMDVIGAEVGGALKNVVAIAAGVAIGAGLGDSARAAVIARGFAEMTRFAVAKGASRETLGGLSGLGDLVLTCTSEKSRNFSAGIALGAGRAPDPNKTVEGLSTAHALAVAGRHARIDMPLSATVNAVAQGEITVETGINEIMQRPLRPEPEGD